jgi:hypothetical protein
MTTGSGDLQYILNQLKAQGLVPADTTLAPQVITNDTEKTQLDIAKYATLFNNIKQPSSTPLPPILPVITHSPQTVAFNALNKVPISTLKNNTDGSSNYSVQLINQKLHAPTYFDPALLPKTTPTTIESFDVVPVERQNELLEKQIQLSEQNNLALNQTSDYNHRHYENLQYYNYLLFWAYLITWTIFIFVLFLFPSAFSFYVRIFMTILFLAVPFVFAYLHSVLIYIYRYLVALIYNRVFNITLNDVQMAAPGEIPPPSL